MEQGCHGALGQPGQGPTKAIARSHPQQEGQQRSSDPGSGSCAGLLTPHRWGVWLGAAAAAGAGWALLALSPVGARALLARLVPAPIAFWAGWTGLGLRHGKS
jgi:hypothetical protein